MKSFIFVLVIFAYAAAYAQGGSETCPKENCIKPEQCEEPVRGNIICGDDTVCCSIVKNEFRTHCRHHGGECMSGCAESLQYSVVDCSQDTFCCVLV
ncbi:uncharacterized protein LOC130673537 [Microplitis mediator]|uniref:uncharacterized protein LOC130673537 n=1 Tax=Microplitis mediator TaxID=375433 RepID=UPI0025534E97|nr:uncharacterized protein LOC130673537 [Microplitis mediator]